MTTQILQHEQQQQAWPWMCSSNSAWSKRVAAMDVHGETTTSWEVRAFAEDASSSGQWPPRSYSCSFCQREFRTAQALGGHMNVHRRERAHANQLAQLRNARFKTSSPTTTTSTTVDLLSPKSDQSEFISSPESESINSSMQTKPFLHDIFSETLITQQQQHGDHSPSRSLYYHPYEKSSSTAARCKLSGSQGRFSLCLNKVMGERHDDTLVDLELRLGRSSCAV